MLKPRLLITVSLAVLVSHTWPAAGKAETLPSAEQPASSTATIDGPRLDNGGADNKPQLFTWLKNQPGDQKDFFKITFQKKNALGIGAMVVGTGVLIAMDQYLFERSWKIGDQLRINHSGVLKTVAKTKLPFSSYVVRLNGPYDLGTGLYFLGDGVTHFSILGSFLAYGALKSDSRALRTSSQLMEAIIANGFVVQVLKHTTGRENPNTLTQPGGKWQWFPNQKDYAKHVNKYDAYPSGHLATAMVTVTVIAENYPEYKFVRPLGYTLMTGLSFQMANNGVHWYSDYPLAIYMGYMFGKIAVNRGRIKTDPTARSSFEVYPTVWDDALGLKAAWRFGGKPRPKTVSAIN